ncbi:MAG: MFS transporter [Verrucomicrobia bacterium]|nr:MFS transporter [Verrucomicrobiota bacterium]MBS0636508.1 MFS transporter [Verrucomicrobiota bacterium]
MEQKFSKKSFIAASLGTLIEYYDYAVLMIFMPIISPIFFPAASAYESLVKGFYTILIAMIARPLGAIFFGHLGDKIGRRYALLCSVYGIAVATILMGVTPSYAQVGIWGGIMLTFTKAVQVFCFAGEYNGAGIYVVELARNKREGFIGSILTATMIVGSLIATLIGYLILQEGMPSWSWRAAIIMGGVVGIIAISSRKTLVESPNFQSADTKKETLKALITGYPYQMLAGIFLGGFATVPFTTVLTFINPVLITKNIVESKSVMLIQALILVVEIITLVVAGRLADRKTPQKVMNSAAGLLALFSLPMLLLVDQASVGCIIAAEAFFIMVNALLLGPSNAYLKNLFPMQFRYRGASLSFTLGLSIFGGLTPIVENYLFSTTHAFYGIAPWLIFTALGTLLSIRLANKHSLPVPLPVPVP